MQLGQRQFSDATSRPVYRSDDGRPYVLDDDGEPVYGVWLHPDEYPSRWCSNSWSNSFMQSSFAALLFYR
jgi:hypothetical protein